MLQKLKVMISSTINDLEAERGAVDQAVRHFQFQRFRSETLGSIARSSREVCDEMAEQCDLYILIVGRRYGWVIPDLNISVTEREYQVARQSDPSKILVYVQDLHPGIREPEGEAFLNRVTDFSSGYFHATNFTSPEQLRNQVKHDIALWVSDKIIKKRLSPQVLYRLASPSDLLMQLGALPIVLLAFGGTLTAIRSSSLGIHGLPSFSDLLKATGELSAQLYPTIATACLAALTSVFGGVVFWIPALIFLADATAQGRFLIVKVLPAIAVISALVLSILGPYVMYTLPPLAAALLVPSLVTAAYFGYYLAIELKEESGTFTTSRDFLVGLLAHILMSPTLSTAFLIAFAALIGVDALGSGGFSAPGHPGMWDLYRRGVDYRRMDYSLAVALNIGVSGYLGYLSLKAVQSYFGGEYVRGLLFPKRGTGASPDSVLRRP